jgi:prepilin-type N-terminal cleavage/methylation domain-containing protein/prepilin-type processing-associated H-X9-DG protein
VSSRRSNAFTLVELLVVIGIISLLVSILMPALSRARRAAQSAACLSNLRQVGQAVFMYTVDTKGRLPYSMTGVASTDPFSTFRDKVFWNALILGGYFPVIAVQSVQTDRGDSFAGVQIVAVLKCPGEDNQTRSAHPDAPWTTAPQQVGRFRNGISGPVYVGLGADTGYSTSYNNNPANRVFTHYGISTNDPVDSPTTPTPFIGSLNPTVSNPWPTPAVFAPQMIARVPAKTWLAFDGVTAYQASGVVFRHPGISANFLYFDGHAENLGIGNVDGAAATPPFPYYVLDSRALVLR